MKLFDLNKKNYLSLEKDCYFRKIIYRYPSEKTAKTHNLIFLNKWFGKLWPPPAKIRYVIQEIYHPLNFIENKSYFKKSTNFIVQLPKYIV